MEVFPTPPKKTSKHYGIWRIHRLKNKGLCPQCLSKKESVRLFSLIVCVNWEDMSDIKLVVCHQCLKTIKASSV